jgi:type I restriction enzyme S subunit
MKAQDLKNSILQLAVQGKLVEQDPNDEPASVLLERIREERAQLIKEKKIKKPKSGESVIYRGSDGSRYEKRVDAKGRESEPVCIDGEIPFEIPKGWEWARLCDLADFAGGKTPSTSDKSNYADNGILWVTSKDMKRDFIDSTLITLSKKGASELTLFDPGTILMVTRSGILRRMLPVAMLKEAATVNQDQKAICPLDTSTSLWLLVYLKASDVYIRQNCSKAGTTVESIVFDKVKTLLIPIPPLAEQRRIAGRVSELMPLVEEYGKLEDEREALDASLPERLRKSVLQMAVEGKLVPQDPGDEPASALLDRIREERAKLTKEKMIKAPKGGESVIYREGGSWYERRGKSEPACIDDEIPFDIPESWEWARLETVTSYIQRGKSPRYSNIEKFPVVAQKCNQWSGFSLRLAKFADPDTVASYAEERILRDGDLLWNSTGIGTLGRMAIYDSRANKYGWAVADSHVTVIRTMESWLNFRFAYSYFAGPSVQLKIESQASGSTKQKELAQETVRNYLVPIPPLEEQQRIVEKVDQIMKLIGA